MPHLNWWNYQSVRGKPVDRGNPPDFDDNAFHCAAHGLARCLARCLVCCLVCCLVAEG